MSRSRTLSTALAALAVLAGASLAAPDAPPSAPAGVPEIPVESFTLPNGLRVHLSEDHTFPVVAYAVTYAVGSRDEPKGRSGFAHLFEHMMFQGSENVGKGEYFKHVENNGGVFNGQTHVDYTNYYAELPAHRLELALWLEADRMRSLAVTEENLRNQQEAVKEEKRLRLDNQPFVGAIVVDLYDAAFSNYANRHSIIGSFDDLDAATIADVKDFFRTHYAPNNAILTLVGDFDPKGARRLVEKHFAGIPRQDLPPPVDTAEPPPEGERRRTVEDPHAPLPGIVVGWRGPERGTPDYYALAVLERILYQGPSSRLYQGLVKGKEVAVEIQGSLGFPLGDHTDYRSPALMAAFIVYKPTIDADGLLGLIEKEVARIRDEGVAAEELERAKVQFRASVVRDLTGALERAIALGAYARFDEDPRRLTRDLPAFQSVTSGGIREAAARWLTSKNRVVIDIRPAAGGPPAEAGAGEGV